jgi:hypothetical protein
MDQPKLERLLRLMKMLTAHNSLTVDEIADKLGISSRSASATPPLHGQKSETRTKKRKMQYKSKYKCKFAKRNLSGNLNCRNSCLEVREY